jgi:hypothetical protein
MRLAGSRVIQEIWRPVTKEEKKQLAKRFIAKLQRCCKQGCQIFPGPNIPKREKYNK